MKKAVLQFECNIDEEWENVLFYCVVYCCQTIAKSVHEILLQWQSENEL